MRTIWTRLRGVSFDHRQDVVARLQPGERVWLVREPDNPYDPNAIQVVTRSHAVIGYLSRELAARYAVLMDRSGNRWPAQVEAIVDSGAADSVLGVRIAFKVPSAVTLQPKGQPRKHLKHARSN